VAWLSAASGSAPSSSAVSTSTPAPTATATPSTTENATVTDSIRVPELASMTLEAARAALASAGLNIGALTVSDSVRAGDTVLSVAPGAGSYLKKGGSVNVVVASGSNQVPPVEGLSSGAAIAALQDAGFVVRTDSGQSEDQPAGTVLSDTVLGSTPGAGTVLRLGTTVTITVVISSSASSVTPTPRAPETAAPKPTATPKPTAVPSPTSPPHAP
jgi:serine/threonine-protein kinase